MNYEIQHTVDVGALYEDLTEKQQMAFLVEKFVELVGYKQKEVLTDVFEDMSFSDVADVIKDAYDGINDDYACNVVANNTQTYTKIAAIATLMDIVNHYNGDWKPDWSNGFQEKYLIVFHHSVYGVTNTNLYNNGIAYFRHQEDAQAVIDNPNFRNILDTIYKN